MALPSTGTGSAFDFSATISLGDVSLTSGGLGVVTGFRVSISFWVFSGSDLQEIRKRKGKKTAAFTANLVVNINDAFNGAEAGVGEFVKFGGHFFDVEAVRDPDFSVDVSGFDNLNDLTEVGGKGIA